MKVNKLIEIFEQQKLNSDLWKTLFHQSILLRKIEMGEISWERIVAITGTKLDAELKSILSARQLPDIRGSKQRNFILFLRKIGFSVSLLAEYFGHSKRHIRRLEERLHNGKFKKILHINKRNKVSLFKNSNVQNAISEILHQPPSLFGINRTTWTIDLLASVVESTKKPVEQKITNTVVSHAIRDMGYKFRKTKEVLTSNDPDYRSKLKDITNTLNRLGPYDRFFSIDEYGPVSVRHRGGRIRVKKGERAVVDQYQNSKGKVIMTAALELRNNQMSYFYSLKKDSEEMIRLADFLQQKYHYCRYLYFSWDAASWHSSKIFLKELDNLNDWNYRNKNQLPKIILKPLPARAQFLNVIESVFSGMSNSVIQNSNYDSVDEMKKAIDRYFEERNNFFRQNQHSAGNKIWGRERTKPTFSVSNNCKTPFFGKRNPA